ncbi:MAG TPA: fructosamine kinase family protein [Polyangia bacterium]|nr:fructosamine kinase family protein [Polyangia bacterium]
MERALKTALGAALGSEVASARPVAGGDINRAYEIALSDGRRLFAKSNARSPRGMFAAEARGLGWLAEAKALRIPRVVTAAEPGAGEQFLVLELIETGRPAPDFDERLGRGLAALHRHGAPGFGLDHDNFVGSLPQANRPEVEPAASWPEFYRARRLEPLLRRAADEGLATSRMRQGYDRLFRALDELCGPAEPPSRLHGDLWGGNLLCDERGAPCLIDPAVYGGHREIDLAMMRLFGGFGARVFEAYAEAAPLADGHRERVTLYQLYPLMVHVNLFGGGYVGQVESALDRLC